MEPSAEDGETSCRGLISESPLQSEIAVDPDETISLSSVPLTGDNIQSHQLSPSLFVESSSLTSDIPQINPYPDELPISSQPASNHEIPPLSAMPAPSSDYGDTFEYEDLIALTPAPVTMLDLTNSPTKPHNPKEPAKRQAEPPNEERPPKAVRIGSSQDTPTTSTNLLRDEIDLVDLRDIETLTRRKENKPKDPSDAVKAQNQEATRPIRLSSIQCIICMDNPTDLTITHCGHLFCSECLHRALFAGDKSCCPVCRRLINLPKAGRPTKNGTFLLELKLMTATKKGKQTSGAH